jgi:hypothetical protein
VIRLRGRWLSFEKRSVDALRCSVGAGQWRD